MAVDPSRSPKGAVDWEDRVASVPLRYLLSKAVSEDLVFRRFKGGFEVFRAYDGVEARADVLKIEETVARSKAGEEVLRRFVEEAKKTAPDLGVRQDTAVRGVARHRRVDLRGADSGRHGPPLAVEVVRQSPRRAEVVPR